MIPDPHNFRRAAYHTVLRYRRAHKDSGHRGAAPTYVLSDMLKAKGWQRGENWTDAEEELYKRFVSEWAEFFDKWHHQWFHRRHKAHTGPRFIVEDYGDDWWGIKHWDFGWDPPAIHGVPEGCGNEWRDVLDAIEQDEPGPHDPPAVHRVYQDLGPRCNDLVAGPRLACEPQGDYTLLYSPRNAHEDRPRDWLFIHTEELKALINGFLPEEETT